MTPRATTMHKAQTTRRSRVQIPPPAFSGFWKSFGERVKREFQGEEGKIQG